MGVPMGEDWETYNQELFVFSVVRILRWAKTQLTDQQL